MVTAKLAFVVAVANDSSASSFVAVPLPLVASPCWWYCRCVRFVVFGSGLVPTNFADVHLFMIAVKQHIE